MAKKPPDKGSVLWHKLPGAPEGYEDVEIGIRFVGAHQARRWMIQMQRIAMEEKSRKRKDGLAEDDNTMEYIEALDKLTSEVLEACVAGAKNVEGMSEGDPKSALSLLEYLGAEAEIATYNLCQEQQTLSLRQRFHTEAAGS